MPHYFLPLIRLKTDVVQWTLEIVDLDLVDSLVLVDKIVLTNYDFMKLILTWNSGTLEIVDILPLTERSTISRVDCTS